jgi:hypothetical protein
VTTVTPTFPRNVEAGNKSAEEKTEEEQKEEENLRQQQMQEELRRAVCHQGQLNKVVQEASTRLMNQLQSGLAAGQGQALLHLHQAPPPRPDIQPKPSQEQVRQKLEEAHGGGRNFSMPPPMLPQSRLKEEARVKSTLELLSNQATMLTGWHKILEEIQRTLSIMNVRMANDAYLTKTARFMDAFARPAKTLDQICCWTMQHLQSEKLCEDCKRRVVSLVTTMTKQTHPHQVEREHQRKENPTTQSQIQQEYVPQVQEDEQEMKTKTENIIYFLQLLLTVAIRGCKLRQASQEQAEGEPKRKTPKKSACVLPLPVPPGREAQERLERLLQE